MYSHLQLHGGYLMGVLSSLVMIIFTNSSYKIMKEFDYNLDYKNLMFEKNDKRYRIGRGEQGVLLVGIYTNDM